MAPTTAGHPTDAVPPDTSPLTLGAAGSAVHGRPVPMAKANGTDGGPAIVLVNGVTLHA